MQLFKYSFVLKNGQLTQRFINLDKVVDILVAKDEKGVTRSVQMLMDAPTNLEHETLPTRAKVNSAGQIIKDKKGNYEISYTHKAEQKHIILSITFEEEMKEFILSVCKDNPENYVFPSQYVPEEIEVESNEAESNETENQETLTN